MSLAPLPPWFPSSIIFSCAMYTHADVCMRDHKLRKYSQDRGKHSVTIPQYCIDRRIWSGQISKTTIMGGRRGKYMIHNEDEFTEHT